MDLDRVEALLRAMEASGVRYVLVGGLALALHGLVRATEDVDFFVDATPENGERLREALRLTFPGDPSVDDISTEDLAGDYPVVRFGPDGVDFLIDFISRLGEAFTYDDIESQDVAFRDVHVRVATPAMLYLMKKDTVRQQDHADAAALREKFGIE